MTKPQDENKTPRYRAVALDIDGTLARADHRVSDYAISVLSSLEKRQIHPIIVTGRLSGSVLPIVKAAGLTAPIVSGGGGVVVDPHTLDLLVHACLEPATVNRLLELAEEHGVQPVTHTNDTVYTDRESRHTDLIAALNGNVHPQVLPPSLWPSDLIKVMLVGDRSNIDALQRATAREFPALKRSTTEFVEANAPGFTKWESLRYVLDRLGISPEETIGAGDGETDLDWLSHVGCVVAVDNAEQSIKDIAHHHVAHHDEDSVARYLAKTLLD